MVLENISLIRSLGTEQNRSIFTQSPQANIHQAFVCVLIIFRLFHSLSDVFN